MRRAAPGRAAGRQASANARRRPPRLLAKELLGATRKYVIPLLEHFDKIGLTVRNDSVRKLKPGWEKVLP